MNNKTMYIEVQILDNNRPIDHIANKRREYSSVRTEDMPQDKLARVKCTTGITINIGNYQSARIDVGIELPCNIDNKDEAYVEASTFCYDNMLEEMTILQQLGKK